MSEESPFQQSSKIRRSPSQTNSTRRNPSIQRDDRTRSQNKQETEINTLDNTQRKEETEINKLDNTQGKEDTQETEISTLDNTQGKEDTQEVQTIINTQEMMSQKEIQKSIASFVPEFSGEDTPNRTSELTRFIGTANSIYDMLEREEEKAVFNKLIQFRLTGDAYVRVMHRQVKDYKALKETLESMYLKTQSLEELENEFTTAQQNYGETIRNYGYRIIEKLQKYKSGFMMKYDLRQIDKAYNTHLDETAVQIFKKGLNNIILRNKMATCRANNVDEMIKETELYEKMLQSATNTQEAQDTHTIQNTSRLFTPPYVGYIDNRITCNYCQRPNHTENVCRVRMFAERRMSSSQQQSQQQEQRVPDFTFAQRNTNQNNYRPVQPNYQHQRRPETYTTHRNNNNQQTLQHYTDYRQPYQSNFRGQRTAQNGNFNTYRQQGNTEFYQRPPKHCSFCKTTTGHTFDECRSKFLRPGQNRLENHNTPAQPNANNELEEKFENMRINATYQEQIYGQGNVQGSNQQ